MEAASSNVVGVRLTTAAADSVLIPKLETISLAVRTVLERLSNQPHNNCAAALPRLLGIMTRCGIVVCT